MTEDDFIFWLMISAFGWHMGCIGYYLAAHKIMMEQILEDMPA